MKRKSWLLNQAGSKPLERIVRAYPAIEMTLSQSFEVGTKNTVFKYVDGFFSSPYRSRFSARSIILLMHSLPRHLYRHTFAAAIPTEPFLLMLLNQLFLHPIVWKFPPQSLHFPRPCLYLLIIHQGSGMTVIRSLNRLVPFLGSVRTLQF